MHNINVNYKISGVYLNEIRGFHGKYKSFLILKKFLIRDLTNYLRKEAFKYLADFCHVFKFTKMV